MGSQGEKEFSERSWVEGGGHNNRDRRRKIERREKGVRLSKQLSSPQASVPRKNKFRKIKFYNKYQVIKFLWSVTLMLKT